MQMYVNYYDREILSADDNPTVGLILCAEKNDAVVRYVLGGEPADIREPLQAATTKRRRPAA